MTTNAPRTHLTEGPTRSNVKNPLPPKQKYLITVDNWFYAPNGQNYKAVWGELIGCYNAKDILGIKVNHRSTDWYPYGVS